MIERGGAATEQTHGLAGKWACSRVEERAHSAATTEIMSIEGDLNAYLCHMNVFRREERSRIMISTHERTQLSSQKMQSSSSLQRDDSRDRFQ